MQELSHPRGRRYSADSMCGIVSAKSLLGLLRPSWDWAYRSNREWRMDAMATVT